MLARAGPRGGHDADGSGGKVVVVGGGKGVRGAHVIWAICVMSAVMMNMTEPVAVSLHELHASLIDCSCAQSPHT